MKIENLSSIKMSLMEINGTLDDEGKTEYLIKGSATFNFTDEIKKQINDNNLPDLVTEIYNELQTKFEGTDAVGVWIKYNDVLFENSIKTEVLNDMVKFGADGLNPIYEFCKMSVIEAETEIDK